MISIKFIWGNILSEGELQTDGKNVKKQTFENTLSIKSVNMPLREIVVKQ